MKWRMKLYCKIKRLLALDVESSTTQAPLIQREMCNLASVLVQWCRVYGTAGGATIFKQYMLNSNQRKIKSYKKAGVYCSKFSRFLRTPSEYIPVSAQDWCSSGNIKYQGKITSNFTLKIHFLSHALHSPCNIHPCRSLVNQNRRPNQRSSGSCEWLRKRFDAKLSYTVTQFLSIFSIGGLVREFGK